MKEPISRSNLDDEMRSRFSVFNLEAFVNWLDSGFRQYVSPSPTEPPFSFVSEYVTQVDTVVMGLGLVYKRLVPDEQKPLFRVAAGRLLLRVVTDATFPMDAVTGLVNLIGEVRAVESLDAVSDGVRAGRYGQDRRWLQYEAISIFKQLMPSPEAVSSLRKLVSLPAFNNRFTFDVLTTLCRYDADNWVPHVANLSSRVSQLYQEASSVDQSVPVTQRRAFADVKKAEDRFVRDFVASVSPEIICRGVKELEEMSAAGLVHLGTSDYDRCLELVRKLQLVDGPFALLYAPISSQPSAYRVRVVSHPGASSSRESFVDISASFKSILFDRPLSTRDYLLALDTHSRTSFERIARNLTNWRDPSTVSPLEPHEFPSIP